MADEVQQSQQKEDGPPLDQEREMMLHLLAETLMEECAAAYAPEPISRLSTPPASESIKAASSETHPSVKTPAQKKLFSGPLRSLLGGENKRRPK